MLSNPPGSSLPPAVPSPAERDNPARAPWGPLEILLAVLAIGVAFFCVSLLMQALLSALGVPVGKAEDDTVGTIVLLLGQVLLDVCAVLAAAAFSLGRYRLSPRAWALRRRQPFAVGLGISVLVSSFAVVTACMLAASALGVDTPSNVPDTLFKHPWAVPFTVLLVVGVAPVCEEMFFRGFVFNGLRRPLGTPGAALISGALFAAIHVSSSDFLWLMLPFTVIGTLFAWLVVRTGSLWNSILVHFCFNLVSTLGQFMPSSAGFFVAVGALVLVFMLASHVNRWTGPAARAMKGAA